MLVNSNFQLQKKCPICAERFPPEVMNCPKHRIALQDAFGDLIGQTLNEQFRIDRYIGQGGMSYVYGGTQLEVDRPVAIKFLKSDVSDDHGKKRFHREALITSKLSHKHIARFYAFGKTPADDTYIVMELLHGDSLADLVESKELSTQTAFKLLQQTAQALSYAHGQDIIHRDIKPSNVVVCKDTNNECTAKLVDFGLARRSGSVSEQRLTEPGYTVGTYGFMSPEQMMGLECDHRSDIYSFGCLLRFVFNPCDDAPPKIYEIIAKCLSKNPDSRYQSMDEVYDALNRLDHERTASGTYTCNTAQLDLAKLRPNWQRGTVKVLALLIAACTVFALVVGIVVANDRLMCQCLSAIETNGGPFQLRKFVSYSAILDYAQQLLRIGHIESAKSLFAYLNQQTAHTAGEYEVLGNAAEELGKLTPNNIEAETFYSKAVGRYMNSVDGYAVEGNIAKSMEDLKRLSDLTQQGPMHPFSGGSLQYSFHTAVSMYAKFTNRHVSTKSQKRLVMLCFERGMPVTCSNGDFGGEFVKDTYNFFDVLLENGEYSDAEFVLTKAKRLYEQWVNDSHRRLDPKLVDQVRHDLAERTAMLQRIKK